MHLRVTIFFIVCHSLVIVLFFEEIRFKLLKQYQIYNNLSAFNDLKRDNKNCGCSGLDNTLYNCFQYIAFTSRHKLKIQHHVSHFVRPSLVCEWNIVVKKLLKCLCFNLLWLEVFNAINRSKTLGRRGIFKTLYNYAALTRSECLLTNHKCSSLCATSFC